MCLRLMLAVTIAAVPSASESLQGRIVTDDAMPLPESARAELRCTQAVLESVGVDGRGQFQIAADLPHPDCAVEVTAPGYRRSVILAAALPAHPGIPGIVLRRLGKSYGESISATHLAAPDEAVESFHAAIRELRRGESAELASVLGHLQAAVRIFPGYAPAWFEIGRLRLAQGDMEEAAGALQRAVRADPWFVSPYQPLILLLEAAGDSEAAASACQSLRKINPALPDDCGGK